MAIGLKIICLLWATVVAEKLCVRERLTDEITFDSDRQSTFTDVPILINNHNRPECYTKTATSLQFDIDLGDCGMEALNVIKDGERLIEFTVRVTIGVDEFSISCLHKTEVRTVMKMATADEDEEEVDSPTDESGTWAETVALTLLADGYQENISGTHMDIGKRVFFELRWKPDFGENFPITMMIDQCTVLDKVEDRSYNVINSGCFSEITSTELGSESAIQSKAIRFSYMSFAFGEAPSYQQSVVCKVKFCLQAQDFFCGLTETVCPTGYTLPTLPVTTTKQPTTKSTTSTSRPTPKPIKWEFEGDPGCEIPEWVLKSKYTGFFGSHGKGLPILLDGIPYWTKGKLLLARPRKSDRVLKTKMKVFCLAKKMRKIFNRSCICEKVGEAKSTNRKCHWELNGKEQKSCDKFKGRTETKVKTFRVVPTYHMVVQQIVEKKTEKRMHRIQERERLRQEITMNDVEHQQFVQYNMEASGAEEYSDYYFTEQAVKEKLNAKIIQIFQDDISVIDH